MLRCADEIVAKEKLLKTSWAPLPKSARLLAIADAPSTIDWLRHALSTDGAMQAQIVAAIGLSAGIERLRDQLYDCIVIVHDADRLDALDLAAGLRAGGSEEAIVVLGHGDDAQMLALAYEAGADAYLQVGSSTVRGLLWTLSRSIRRHELERENRRLRQFERHRTELDERETEQLLLQQRAMVDELQTLRSESAEESHEPLAPRAVDAKHEPCPLPDGIPALLDTNYRELLRSYVIMGAGNLANEMERFAGLLAQSGLSARHTLQLHLRAVEDLVQGLRSKSTRHIMSRADLLILEVMVHLAEWYQRRDAGRKDD